MNYAAIIIGGGPAGLAAAVSAGKSGKQVLLIEREKWLGGILKQCIHDGFGVIRFGEKLSGPEYADRFIEELVKYPNVTVLTETFVIDITGSAPEFLVTATNSDGIKTHSAANLIFACGCRERTPRQINIHGSRPAGLITAGACQNYVNLIGAMPTKKCVILGSGDIGLIMARRLTLEGAEVLGVYEAKNKPSGLTRNIVQCLEDFDIPLYLKKTVTRVFGRDRLNAVEISDVDDNMNPLPGTETVIPCDACIVSVGLIPETELFINLPVKADNKTKSVKVDQNMMTDAENVYVLGNALNVHDLVDYVSETGDIAGNHAVIKDKPQRALVPVKTEGLLYAVPQYIDTASIKGGITVYFRSAVETESSLLTVSVSGRTVFTKKYARLKPPEMEKLFIPITEFGGAVDISLKEIKK